MRSHQIFIYISSRKTYIPFQALYSWCRGLSIHQTFQIKFVTNIDLLDNKKFKLHVFGHIKVCRWEQIKLGAGYASFWSLKLYGRCVFLFVNVLVPSVYLYNSYLLVTLSTAKLLPIIAKLLGSWTKREVCQALGHWHCSYYCSRKFN